MKNGFFSGNREMANILMTGEAEFIVTHIALMLLKAGHDRVVLDNVANSSPEWLWRMLELASSDASLAAQHLKWHPQYSLEDMCRDSGKW